jgi:clan AA aspartic protease (TIGR02281 family)
MYYKGDGVPQNYAEALKWFRLAATQGQALAQNNLGVMYYIGEGVPQNYAEALKWFRLAATQGQAFAQNNLGLMYENGHGVPPNYVRAYIWYNLSAAQGYQEPLYNREQVARLMTPAQIAEAQNPTNEYAPSASPDRNPSSQMAVPMKNDGGTFVVPVQINGAITLDFTVDSGASDVSVPADVFSTLVRTGTIRDADIIGEQTFVLADGSKSQSVTFTIRSLKVGNKIVENVRGGVVPAQGSLLLGQSFLERFRSWSIDNSKHELILEPQNLPLP